MNAFDKIKKFLHEVMVEMRKITWPSLSELRESTTVVIISVLIITAFIWVVDLILNTAITFLIRVGT
ncbi:MAG: preprotein translocase subunit SecE [Candidatus Eisenbacteria bacterium]|nr:preprotein translocase subunit SecE [Candidatus Eisenbacteria bacterium]